MLCIDDALDTVNALDSLHVNNDLTPNIYVFLGIKFLFI